MAIQIRELIVRASIREEQEQRRSRENRHLYPREQIIEESAEKLIQILKDKKER